MSWIYLSHILDENTPLYNDTGNIDIKRSKCISAGDSCNTSDLSLPVHSGTHLDAPYHFDDNGKTIDEYPPDFWVCSRPFVIDFPFKIGKLLTYESLSEQLKKVTSNCDILLIKTGAENQRGDSSRDYSKKGIGFDLELAEWIRENLNIKIIGFDFISLSSPLEREIGRKAHKALLCSHPSKKDPVLILEDLSLKNLKTCPNEVLVVPFIFTKSDGAMTTVLAKT